MLRRLSQRCVDADILVCTSTAVQRQAYADGRYPVLSAAVSAMYSVFSWTKNLGAKGIRDVTS